MPFTGSHPAAILPLLGSPLPASALVIGSIAPDLPYYLPLDTGVPTHTAGGVLSIDVVLGGATWLLWHGVLAAPALAAAPAALRSRVLAATQLGLGRRLRSVRLVALVLAALVVGSATHVLWDELSHPGRWGTEHVAALRSTWFGLAGYRWVQYASGVLGALAIADWLRRWYRRTPPRQADRRPGRDDLRVWVVLLVIGAAGGGVAALRSDTLREAAFRAVTVGGGTAAVLGLVLALGWHLRALPRPGAR